MSWKTIDSRANTSGSALYADTVFYNKTNHDLEAVGSTHHPHLSSEVVLARNVRTRDTLTVKQLDGLASDTPHVHILANHTANSGLPTVEIKGTGDGTTASPYGNALAVKGDATITGGLKLVGGGDVILSPDNISVFPGTLQVGGSLAVSDGFTQSGGSASLHQTTLHGGTTVTGGSLGVNSDLTVSGFASIGGQQANGLSVSGNTLISGSLDISGGPLTVQGDAVLFGVGTLHEGLISYDNVTVIGGNIGTDQDIGANGTITGGTLVSQGDVTCFQSSDQRLKEDIRQIENAGETIDKLRGVRYKWRDEWFKENKVILAHQDDMGFIAQEVEEVVT